MTDDNRNSLALGIHVSKMPGTRCTVAVCNNSFEKTKKAGMKIMYHQFPKAQPYRDIWIERCRRAGDWNPNSCHVCSIHFKEDDYRKDSTSELLNMPGRLRLKATAVPSLFLTEPPPLEIKSVAKRKRKKLSVDDDTSEYLTDDNTIYLKVEDCSDHNEPLDDFSIFEICPNDDSNESSVIYVTECDKNVENNYEEKLKTFYIDKMLNEKINPEEEISEQASCSSPQLIHCAAFTDSSTQTDPDYLLENYKQLIHKNQILEKEIVRWTNKCKQLVSNMKFLESKVQKLSINSGQTQ